LKPNSKVLADIIESVGGVREQTIYVGDSLTKDIAMAQEAGVIDVFASYGVMQHREQYQLLRRVSHWTDAQVERERQVRTSRSIQASYTLRERFGEVLGLFDVERFVARFSTDAPTRAWGRGSQG
jgi:histidinol phosphatase-like enzyme